MTTTRTKTCMICGHTAGTDTDITYELMGGSSDPDRAWILACVDQAACAERVREAALAAMTDPEESVVDLW